MILMRHAFLLLALLLASVVDAKTVSKSTAVTASGETTLTARYAKVDVHVSIRTRLAEKGEATIVDGLGGYVARSYVERLAIVVADNPIWVSRSVFCDLFDVHIAELRLEGKKRILKLDGGDASESYWVEIEFDSEQIRKKVTGSGMTPGKPSSATTYYPMEVLN